MVFTMHFIKVSLRISLIIQKPAIQEIAGFNDLVFDFNNQE